MNDQEKIIAETLESITMWVSFSSLSDAEKSEKIAYRLRIFAEQMRMLIARERMEAVA